jgi:uncharacterized membrane protein YhaH (DUF805 family)
MNEINVPEPQEKNLRIGHKSSLFNLKNISSIAAVLVGLRMVWEVDYFRSIILFFPILPNIMGISYLIGLVIFFIGFLLDRNYKSIRIPTIIAIIGIGLCLSHVWFGQPGMPMAIFFPNLVIQISLLVFLVPLLMHKKSDITKSMVLLVIVFISLNLIGTSFLYIKFQSYWSPSNNYDFREITGDYGIHPYDLITTFSLNHIYYGLYTYFFPVPIPPVIYFIHWGFQIFFLGLILTFACSKENNLTEWYLKVVRDNYVNFNGRAQRKEYWMFLLTNMIFLLSMGLMTSVAIRYAEINYQNVIIFWFIYTLYGLALFIPSLAVGVRRLHDVGKSGWWLFISLIPIIGGIWLLILVCTDSNPGENDYGPSPKVTPIFNEETS